MYTGVGMYIYFKQLKSKLRYDVGVIIRELSVCILGCQ